MSANHVDGMKKSIIYTFKASFTTKRKVNGKRREVFIGSDNQLWYYDDAGRGQVTCASSGEAYEWAKRHGAPGNFLRGCYGRPAWKLGCNRQGRD